MPLPPPNWLRSVNPPPPPSQTPQPPPLRPATGRPSTQSLANPPASSAEDDATDIMGGYVGSQCWHRGPGQRRVQHACHTVGKRGSDRSQARVPPEGGGRVQPFGAHQTDSGGARGRVQ